MSLTGAIAGFKYLGQTKDGLWGKYLKSEDFNADEFEQWKLERDRRALREAQKRAESLPAKERDRLYQELLRQLGLHPRDREDLHRRGITDEQIQSWGVKSVDQWQKLDQELIHELAGVNLDGRSLNTSQAGYLCPIKDIDGLIVGFQVRAREKGSRRYYWLTGKTRKRRNGPTPHLPNGELPLAVHRPESIQRQAIALVEGIGPKPFILAHKYGVTTIGAAGGLFAASPQTLETTLQQFSEELQTKTIEFFPDAGAVQNTHVLRQYRVTFSLLRRWGYEVKIAWWGQTDKRIHPDIDELEDTSQLKLISVREFEAIALEHTTLLKKLKTILGQFAPRPAAQGFDPTPQDQPKTVPKDVVDIEPETETPITEYSNGHRLQAWQSAIAQGYQYILDCSPPGTGKSHDSGLVTIEAFNVRQVLYLSEQHRNPTVDTLSIQNGWTDLEARHGGLVRVTTAGGSRLQRLSRGDIPVVTANCSRNGVLNALRDKNITGADTASLICGTCVLREACTHSDGPGYGYLNQRHHALASTLLRAHPDSLPDPEDYGFDDVLLLWDEPGQNFRLKREIKVSFHDLQQTITALLSHPELFQKVQPLLSALLPLMDGSTNTGKFGFNLNQLKERLRDIAHLDAKAIARALIPHMGFLNTTSEYGVDLADLPKALRKMFSDRDTEVAQQAQTQIIKQWLPDFIYIVQGHPGAVHLSRTGLTISLPDWRHRAIARQAFANVFLDATLSREDLALKLGCEVEDIKVVRQRIPQVNNLKIIQVPDIGRAGMYRGGDQLKRTQALIHHYQESDPHTKVIDFKKFGADGAWWRDSRGVNDFLDTHTLILCGTPCRNLNDLAAEYSICTGVYPYESDEQFKAFVDRAILAEIHQAIGRLRAHRRPIELLTLVLISNIELDFPAQVIPAQEITPDAGTKVERVKRAIAGAIGQIKASGQRVTQQLVSAVTSIPRGTIARYWALFISLVESSNSKMNNQDDESVMAIASLVEVIVNDGGDEVLASLDEVFYDWLQPYQWPDVWRSLGGKVQMSILEALSLTLPEKSWREWDVD